MSGLVGNTTSLRSFSQSLRNLPRVLAQKVAAAAAPALTEVARASFAAGEDSKGVTWEPNKDGTRATLQRSGSLAGKITYTAIGTIIRVVLGVPYARYQIGRRPIFPKQGEPLPVAYVRELERVTRETIARELAVTS